MVKVMLCVWLMHNMAFFFLYYTYVLIFKVVFGTSPLSHFILFCINIYCTKK